MQMKNSTAAYGLVSIVLHWVMALAIFALIALGLWMVELNYYSPWYQQAPFWHKSVGLLLVPILLFRLYWRLQQPTPEAPAGHARWERRLATLTHGLLYLLLLLTLISGYMISTAKGDGISLFGWFQVPALVSGLDNQADLAGTLHYWSAISILGLAALHALGALKHHVLDRDTTLVRMLKPETSTHKET
ncbi:cytochrome b [Marinobacterium marinum]|uniref:Cytochrome b n=1 Tax=Marinobacterium marinum TaxID=2756129 RepID=A0A7W1WZ40_9GAMM|nr:cytochrome b [Marinobacterium marinum]MBA4502899.1 cytochrome b [Marinobacterium marinum]